ncbi:hypothetical protein PARPLA_01027 [Rhodobacteraceae bacterium THAF1]|uniref:nitrile hydratase accessory protein n=1 Tax=Palleronia sp. THAF1 TaxID=2587842 RepID=UPI000F402EFA|nr:nitrile hydratase accessory protein [Palleronia sp. THAF1]QFU07450.1 hypothetical protein FIU81_02045 [Palleronia sp. THAF1]VDC20638.1 hypothetical protein PARPLA_01027 [Rhodobacteraceae bacterium THAF1]
MTEPPFKAPWHAQAFALTHHLADRGVITWTDWTEALATQIAERCIVTANDYYTAWIAAIETLVDAPEALTALRDAWADAHATTPHGQPVRLPSSF